MDCAIHTKLFDVADRKEGVIGRYGGPNRLELGAH